MFETKRDCDQTLSNSRRYTRAKNANFYKNYRTFVYKKNSKMPLSWQRDSIGKKRDANYLFL